MGVFWGWGAWKLVRLRSAFGVGLGKEGGCGGKEGGTASVEMRSKIRVEADYVERQDRRGNKFAHACPRCASRLRRTGERSPQRWRIARPGPVAPFVGDPVPRCVFCKRPLSRIGDKQEGLFGEPERTRWRRECARRGPGDRRLEGRIPHRRERLTPL